jgi:serine/threonine protein kinase
LRPQTEIIRLKQVDHIMSEKAILQAINHPLIITLYGTSQDDLHLYMYMEFVSGGELFSHLRRAGRFTNDTGKFFAASIILAMQHLHGASPRSSTCSSTRTRLLVLPCVCVQLTSHAARHVVQRWTSCTAI